MIVSIRDGSSYDALFVQVPQKAPEGQVSVFQVEGADLPALYERLKDNKKGEQVLQFSPFLTFSRQSLKKLPRTWIPFLHLALCSTGNVALVALAITFLTTHISSLQSGCLTEEAWCATFMNVNSTKKVMFSDFSLKALIADWKEPLLGPNPFKNVGGFSGKFELRFDCETLKNCPSAQLVTVAGLCSEGVAQVGVCPCLDLVLTSLSRQ